MKLVLVTKKNKGNKTTNTTKTSNKENKQNGFNSCILPARLSRIWGHFSLSIQKYPDKINKYIQAT